MPKKLPKPSPYLVQIRIYGIWSKVEKRPIFIHFEEETVEMEFDMEGYSDETHSLVCFDAVYDASSLES